MSLRIFSPALALALLAGCGAQSPEPAGQTVECATGGASDFGPVCTLERAGDGDAIVIHHPDGGFRRLRIDPATGIPAALDGAEPLVIEEGQGVLQFAIGPDRYRLPADLAPTPAAP